MATRSCRAHGVVFCAFAAACGHDGSDTADAPRIDAAPIDRDNLADGRPATASSVATSATSESGPRIATDETGGVQGEVSNPTANYGAPIMRGMLRVADRCALALVFYAVDNNVTATSTPSRADWAQRVGRYGGT